MELNLIWDTTTALATALMTLFGIMTAGHAMITKRDAKGAFGWIAVCLVFPFVGPFIYYVFGINRVQRRAKKLYYGLPLSVYRERFEGEDGLISPVPSVEMPASFVPQARISDRVARRSVCPGNSITLLHNGEEAYPAMLDAIDQARFTVFLTTYIFEVDKTGDRFVAALERAHQRGVMVRILIDGVGEMSWGRLTRLASRRLRRKGLSVARFIPPTLIPPTLYINLRNHRKILVIDGETAFTGGMNIGDHHLVGKGSLPDRQTTDIHFLILGPVARQIEQVFMEDWFFTTGETLTALSSLPKEAGSSFCRVISDGPDEQMGKLYMILSGVISSAQHSIRIMTPYFLPPRGILTALQTAIVRGVHVEIILPEKNDVQFVHWATRNMLWELLEYEAAIYYQPAPFAHTKLILVDDHYVQAGSANIDSRSLRLNFELNVEIYDQNLASELKTYFESLRSRCRRITLQELDGRSLLQRLRDAFAWLFSSYL
ncbi:MAG: PLDc N-terminal domain-containing protein [Syntrophaceae bacterium]|nr:PLDc N-terminal domain-containing protein [Syntrophaceae bacterium]